MRVQVSEYVKTFTKLFRRGKKCITDPLRKCYKRGTKEAASMELDRRRWCPSIVEWIEYLDACRLKVADIASHHRQMYSEPQATGLCRDAVPVF